MNNLIDLLKNKWEKEVRQKQIIIKNFQKKLNNINKIS